MFYYSEDIPIMGQREPCVQESCRWIVSALICIFMTQMLISKLFV